MQNTPADNYYESVCKKFQEKTGIIVSDFQRSRCLGDSDSYKIGDYVIEGHGDTTITNTKTGVTLVGQNTPWEDTTNGNSIPSASGHVFLLSSYSDKDGNTVTFTQNTQADTLQPESAVVKTKDGESVIHYQLTKTIDPEIYNFCFDEQ